MERLEEKSTPPRPPLSHLKVQNLPPGAGVALACREPASPRRLRRPSPPEYALDFTISRLRSGEWHAGGQCGGPERCEPGPTVTLPGPIGFELTNRPYAEPGTFLGTLRGMGLEGIARTGLTVESSREVTALPAPEGDAQKLEIAMPWPARRRTRRCGSGRAERPSRG